MSESKLVQQIIVAASEHGSRLFVNSVGFYKRVQGGRYYGIHYGVGGNNAPDLIGHCADAIVAYCEVKVPGKKPRPGQLAWMIACKRSNPLARVGWVDSVAGALRLLQGAEPDPVTMYVHG